MLMLFVSGEEWAAMAAWFADCTCGGLWAGGRADVSVRRAVRRRTRKERMLCIVCV